MPTPIIALSGKRFTGKDTLASLLCARRPELRRGALADESKRAFVEAEARAGVAVDLARLVGDRAYKEPWRPRLTRFTEAELARDPAVFCQRLLPPGDEAPRLVTDVRLAHDAAYLRAHGDLLLVRITCADETRRRFGWSFQEGVDTHRTETELDDYQGWDLVVPNEGTLDDLDRWAGLVLDRFATRVR